MTKKQIFLALVSEDDLATSEWAKDKQRLKSLHRASQKVAVLILKRLNELGWSQKQLAEKIGVSPQMVNKWVKGKENFTIQTLIRLGEVMETTFFEIKPISPVKKIEIKQYYNQNSAYEPVDTLIGQVSISKETCIKKQQIYTLSIAK